MLFYYFPSLSMRLEVISNILNRFIIDIIILFKQQGNG